MISCPAAWEASASLVFFVVFFSLPVFVFLSLHISHPCLPDITSPIGLDTRVDAIFGCATRSSSGCSVNKNGDGASRDCEMKKCGMSRDSSPSPEFVDLSLLCLKPSAPPTFLQPEPRRGAFSPVIMQVGGHLSLLPEDVPSNANFWLYSPR